MHNSDRQSSYGNGAKGRNSGTDARTRMIARDGRRLFALGWHLRGEVMRYDTASQRFEPHFGSRSAARVTSVSNANA